MSIYSGYHTWDGNDVDDLSDHELATPKAPASQLRDLDDDYTRRGAPWDDRPDAWEV